MTDLPSDEQAKAAAEWLTMAAKCIYLATDRSVAEDISKNMIVARDVILSLLAAPPPTKVADPASPRDAADGRLLPCPFCGGEAELDHRRSFRALSDGRIGEAVAIYCLGCSADMTMCHADHSGLEIEDMAEHLIAAWNKRPSPPPVLSNWREIETAPKDGTRVLAELEDGEGIEIIEWEADGWKGPGWVHSTGKWSAFPIRWWPLPASSKEKSNG